MDDTIQTLQTRFDTKDNLISFVKQLAPWAEGEASTIEGKKSAAIEKLNAIDPIAYGRTRNFANGKITHLSPYIHHGLISLNDVRNHALTLCQEPVQIIKFLQELGWRDFWLRVLETHQEWAWNDIEPYKTGFTACDYADVLPDDIRPLF
jgi:deoxyribodipyrimidine photo-lyase